MMDNRTQRVLAGERELRDYCLAGEDPEDIYTASDVVVEEIDKIVAAGNFPYNRTVAQAVARRLGIPEQPQGSNLYGVVYASQGYRDCQRLVAAGFEPFTPALLQRAYDGGQKIEVQVQGALGFASCVVLQPRRIDGRLYAMRPRARHRHVVPAYQPARLVN
jgi:hypothetical protein